MVNTNNVKLNDNVDSSISSIVYGIKKNVVGVDIIPWGTLLGQRIRDERGNYMFIPKITDVEVIDNDNVKVVIVKFEDGTFEKAVQNPDDTYSLEQGISICITKKLISRYTDNATREYNKLIRNAIKVMNNNKMIAEKKAADEQAAKARTEKLIAKKKARKAKLEAAENERMIKIALEAYHQMFDYTEEKIAKYFTELDTTIEE